MRRTALWLAPVACVLAAGCWPTIDESLMNQWHPSEDAEVDGEAAVVDAPTDADAALDGDAKADGDAAGDTGADGDAKLDAVSEDAKPDAPDATGDAKDGEASVDEDAEAGDDAAEEPEAEVDAEVEAGEDADAADVTLDVTPDVSPLDGGIVVCTEDTECPPVGCNVRRCDKVKGQCVSDSTLDESPGSFTLANSEAPVCNQGPDRACVVAVGAYVAALTGSGLQVWNVRNPKFIKQETLSANVAPGSSFLVRSGQRVWAAAPGTGGWITVSWLDMPLDGVSPLPPLYQKSVYLGGSLEGAYPAPNDTLMLKTTSAGLPAFARFGPGLLSYLTTRAAVSSELISEASSADRAVLHSVTNTAGSFHHAFSLQINATTSGTSNNGTVDVTTLTSNDGARGYFASSRKGSVAWVIGGYDSGAMTWKDVRAFWLVDPVSSNVATGTEFLLEQFTAQQISNPIGPLAFVDENTIAAVAVSAFAPPVALEIVSKPQNKVTKRIVMGTVPVSGISVAGDSGFVYVVNGADVHMFVPACNP